MNRDERVRQQITERGKAQAQRYAKEAHRMQTGKTVRLV